MNWDTYHTKKISEKYVYRYVTIEKLIDFLLTGSIYLSRLDTFEDNFENMQPYDINELKFLYLKKPEDANPEIPDHNWDEIIENSKVRFSEIQEYLHKEQKKRFVSCWFLNDVESFGMWDIYGKSGFAIRFEQKYFQDLIKKSIQLQIEPTSNIDLLVAGKVVYQNFDEMLIKEEESLIKYSAFRKHLSFKHESEFRIIGFMDNVDDYKGLRFKLPSLDTLKFDIIANPRLSSFQFLQFKHIIETYAPKHKLIESELKLWLEFRKTKY